MKCLLAALLIVTAAAPAVRAGQMAANPEAVLAQAEALNAKGAYRESLALLGALERDTTLPPLERARLLCHRGIAQASTGQSDEALRSADEAERLAAPAQDAELLARVELVRGAAIRVHGGPLRARPHYELAIAHAGRLGNRRSSRRGTRPGQRRPDLGEWSRVLYYASARGTPTPAPTRRAARGTRCSVGSRITRIPRSEAAERSFKEALAIPRRPATATASVWPSVNWASPTSASKNPTGALDHFNRAIALARDIGSPDLEVTWLVNSGNLFRDRGDVVEALRRYRRGLDLERKAGQVRTLPILLKNIGQTLALGGRPDDAEPYCSMRYRKRTVRIRSRSAGRRGWSWVRSSRASIRRAPIATSATAWMCSKSSTTRCSSRTSASALSADRSTRTTLYDLYVTFLLDRGETNEAFLVAERARARAFLDTLRAAREQIAADVPPHVVAAERDILQRISSRQAELRTGQLDAPKRQSTADAVRADEDALTTLRLKLAAEHPAVASVRFPRLPGLDEVQRIVLRDDEALLLFFVGRKGSASWLVTRDRVSVARLPARADLEGPIREYLAALQTPRSEHREPGARLWRTLGLDRTEALKEGRRLTVIPHGILNYLPFEAVPDPNGRYLMSVARCGPRRWCRARVPGSQPRRATRSGEVIAVGNPVIGGSVTAATERSVRIDAVDLLKPLAHAAYELRDVAALFGRRGRVLEQARATESALARTDVQSAAILHFATHGLIDEERPERSMLALTAQPPESDGLLQMREIYGLRLRAALVTLSACQTALGKNVTGEGIVGFSRAFFYAGANAVMASLWNVNDASTAEFMTAFYEKLSRGESIDRAAREAKLRFLRSDDSTRRHPYYWAPFVVSGNASADVPVGGDLTNRTVAGVAVAAVALVVAAYATVRRRRPGTAAAPIA